MAIRGIGTDIVDVGRFKTKISKDKFLELTFTDSERSYCTSQTRPEEHYAARFAAKEAYMKALGSGWGKEADFKDIEIYKNKEGAPQIKLHGNAAEYFKKEKLQGIFVSISHTRSQAVAFVIINE